MFITKMAHPQTILKCRGCGLARGRLLFIEFFGETFIKLISCHAMLGSILHHRRGSAVVDVRAFRAAPTGRLGGRG